MNVDETSISISYQHIRWMVYEYIVILWYELKQASMVDTDNCVSYVGVRENGASPILL